MLGGHPRLRALRLGLVLYLLGLSTGCGQPAGDWTTSRPVHGFRVVASYPHDPEAFTQGLAVQNGQLYEGTGNYGESFVRRVDLATGRTLQETRLAPDLFGEGITLWDDRIVQLTWREHQGLVYARASLELEHSFDVASEGWGITHDGRHWILSDGTEMLRFLDPETQSVVKTIRVTDAGRPVRYLNELEYIEGQIWANIWHNDMIARIDPRNGEVLSYVNLVGLHPGIDSRTSQRVLNGIAYDANAERIFVTGKNWPRLYEIQLVPPSPDH